MTTATSLLSEISEQGISLSVNGDKLRVHNTAALTDEIRQALKEYKPALLALLQDAVPQSLKDRACGRCGSHEGRKRDDGLWLCVCYFDPAPVSSPPPKQRPTWDSLMLDNRGLARTCSQCDAETAWYGKDCTPYCDDHWAGNRHGR